ncbi:MAG: hypothetical protein H0W83_15110, partial [Planctomycetes bacterium]|nr:hypothetical protein [Planctomycetota bacterium]
MQVRQKGQVGREGAVDVGRRTSDVGRFHGLRIEGLGLMVLYVACALAFLRVALPAQAGGPIQAKGGLLTLSLALLFAAAVAAWRTP